MTEHKVKKIVPRAHGTAKGTTGGKEEGFFGWLLILLGAAMIMTLFCIYFTFLKVFCGC